ncbi:hypothetical protein BD289DRAFT_32704 [Coniella lustricola]|uniref:Uncharacterized protein n=1 Tax=Coniella lustricola TaxID=2025994 RepID=A0A2T3A2L5_9PEZI|nr:hypothetical protein BD289DRAFT_32704 [Coniella lustricola]
MSSCSDRVLRRPFEESGCGGNRRSKASRILACVSACLLACLLACLHAPQRNVVAARRERNVVAARRERTQTYGPGSVVEAKSTLCPEKGWMGLGGSGSGCREGREMGLPTAVVAPLPLPLLLLLYNTVGNGMANPTCRASYRQPKRALPCLSCGRDGETATKACERPGRAPLHQRCRCPRRQGLQRYAVLHLAVAPPPAMHTGRAGIWHSGNAKGPGRARSALGRVAEAGHISIPRLALLLDIHVSMMNGCTAGELSYVTSHQARRRYLVRSIPSHGPPFSPAVS